MSRADHRRRTGARIRFRPLAALAAATLVAIGLMPVESAAADPVGSCSTSRGVLVVVDLRHFGGSITRGCDATPSTGYDALHAAGFTTAGTHHDGPGFICRIDGHPSVGQDPCFNTPPATAYWSYWHANAGRTSWSYSTNGAQSYSPQPGSIDAWVFGGTSPPSFSPAVARGATAPVTKPKPTPHRSTTSHPTRRGAATTVHSRQHGERQASSTSVQRTSAHASATTTAHPSSSSSGSPSRAPTSASVSSSSAIAVAAGDGAPTIVDASSTTAAVEHSSSGSVWPAVLGLVLAVALAAGAGWTVLRRRRAAS